MRRGPAPISHTSNAQVDGGCTRPPCLCQIPSHVQVIGRSAQPRASARTLLLLASSDHPPDCPARLFHTPLPRRSNTPGSTSCLSVATAWRSHACETKGMDQPGLVEPLIIPARHKRVMGRLLQGMFISPATMAPGLTSVVPFNRACKRQRRVGGRGSQAEEREGRRAPQVVQRADDASV